MTLTTKVLLALAAGLALGIAISVLQSPALTVLVPILEPVGSLWIGAIRMTVIPLVVGSIIVGVTSAPDARTIGRIGTRALAIFLLLLLTAGVFAALIAPPILDRLPLDPAAIASLRATAAGTASQAAESAQKIPTFAQWLVDLVPVNPVKAAADGAMLPLIVFSVVFGLAITRLTSDARELLQRFFRAVSDAALTLVRWVLAAAPLGVFALSVTLAAKLGLAAAGALVGYVLLVVAMTIAFALLVLYPFAVVFGRVGLSKFARAAFPAQAVALSSRSSLASLPAMMESARSRLGLPEQVTSFFLPLAASTFRVGGSVGLTLGVAFIARLYGVPLAPAQLATVVLTVIVTTFSIPGIPGGSIIAMVPTLMAAGLPVEGMGILLGVDTIPDMFRTATNITGDMTAAVVLARNEPRDDPRDGARSASP